MISESDLAQYLSFVVENGRVEGDTPSERMASAKEEVRFELAENGLASKENSAAADKFVENHYKP